MGCDVHCHVEIKLGDKWHHFNMPRLERNYDLFEKMAGVRGHERKAIAPPRGIPEDATFETRFDYEHWGMDAHTASWLSSEEVAALVDWYPEHMKSEGYDGYASLEHEQLGYIFGNGWDFNKYPLPGGGYDGQPPELKDARLVFWFDN